MGVSVLRSIMPGSQTSVNFKVVLLGEGCVGKSSIVLRYVEDKFNSSHLSTMQAAFMMKKLQINDTRVNLAIWDTAGQERFHALGPIYYRDAQGAVLVYDITDEDSFQKVKVWVKELRRMVGSDISLVIAGNKVDLERKRNVEREMAEEFAASVNAIHVHTSAKNNEGIDGLFMTLAETITKLKDKTNTNTPSQRQNIRIVDDQELKKKSGCC